MVWEKGGRRWGFDHGKVKYNSAWATVGLDVGHQRGPTYTAFCHVEDFGCPGFCSEGSRPF